MACQVAGGKDPEMSAKNIQGLANLLNVPIYASRSWSNGGFLYGKSTISYTAEGFTNEVLSGNRDYAASRNGVLLMSLFIEAKPVLNGGTNVREIASVVFNANGTFTFSTDANKIDEIKRSNLTVLVTTKATLMGLKYQPTTFKTPILK